MIETLRLFKALPVDKTAVRPGLPSIKEANLKTIPKGFILAPEVIGAWRNLDAVVDMVNQAYGLDPKQLNAAFHKSWDKVRNASLNLLYIEQMANYLTTYGAEAVGLYNADRVFIPVERLDTPDIEVENFAFVVIRGMTNDELRVALLDLLTSGVALAEQTVKDCLVVASTLDLSPADVESVRNREVKIGLYDLIGTVPTDPVEFLRLINYKLTGSTLLIKNNEAVEALKDGATKHSLLPLFNLYSGAAGLERLAEVFLRFKPLFLALRSDKALRPTINKIRRLATSNHKPMPVDFLNNVTASIKRSPSEFNMFDLEDELSNPNVTNFRKIRLAQALRVRMDPSLDSALYKIRNGRSFAAPFEPLSDASYKTIAIAYHEVMNSIAQSIVPKVLGKKVFIPEGVVYGLPSTERQFIGNIPAGTYVQTNHVEGLVAGVYWEDQGSQRIDLDLSIANVGGKIGWDGDYRNQDKTVLFSGDNTSAPKGASEVFYFGEKADGSWLMNVNYYNLSGYAPVPVPFKIVVGTADPKKINSNFVINPNLLMASASSVIDVKQVTIGLVSAEANGVHRFYFSPSNLGGGISARHNEHAERARKFMVASMQDAPSLNEILYYAGVERVETPEEADEGFDLSPAAIDKTTILSLLS